MSQSEPFFFLSRLSQAFCDSNRKLTHQLPSEDTGPTFLSDFCVLCSFWWEFGKKRNSTSNDSSGPSLTQKLFCCCLSKHENHFAGHSFTLLLSLCFPLTGNGCHHGQECAAGRSSSNTLDLEGGSKSSVVLSSPDCTLEAWGHWTLWVLENTM